MRTVTNSDLWAAIRGVGMYKMTHSELVDLASRHDEKPDMFASRVIATAARPPRGRSWRPGAI